MAGLSGAGALLILLAVIGGALIAAQGPIFARLAGSVGGTLPAALLSITIGTGALISLILVTGTPFPKLADMRAAPAWVWAGGLIGAYQVMLSITAVPKIGVVAFFTAVIAYDQLGAFGLAVRALTVTKMVGIGLLVGGLALIVWER
jgi:transporter family-2 protein